MTDPTPLDPDEIACRRCRVGPSTPCQTPAGKRAKSIHVERRRDAQAGKHPLASDERGTPIPNADEGRRRGGATTAQARRRRRAEAAARAEQERERLEAEALAEEARRIAEDAVRYDRHRTEVRANVLETTRLAYDRFKQGLEGLQVVHVDSDGRPMTAYVEREDKDGNPKTVAVPDVRGAYPVTHVERLGKIAAQALVSLRLEEQKPTGITRTQTEEGGVAEILGSAGVREMAEWLLENAEPESDGP